LQLKLSTTEKEHSDTIQTRVEPVRQRREAEEELQLLNRRQGNLPPAYVRMRQQLCEELSLTERDLPFAAELIAVKQDQHEWEASIEMALRGFGLSLLVPQRHYQNVSRLVEGLRLSDTQGRGQKLVYLRVSSERRVEGQPPGPQSLYWKLNFRDNRSPLLPWVKAELQERHNIRCCDTIEEFQQTHDRAMTRNRHMKLGPTRHEKDDRERVADPRSYVLGWDNKEKKRRLAEIIQELTQRISQIDTRAAQLDKAAKTLTRQLSALDEADRTTSFLEIDYFSHDQQITQLREELRAFQENSDMIRLLHQRLVEHEERVKALDQNREQLLRHEESVKQGIKNGQQVLTNQSHKLSANIADGSFALHEMYFPDLDRLLDESPLSLDNFASLPETFRHSQDAKVRRLREDLLPVAETVRKAMFKFLKENPEEKLDLEDSIE
jgi:uncharacterized protein YPO0396